MPISQAEIRAVVERYPKSLVVATVGSHAALDVADGAVTEGLPSLVLGQTGREATYARYFRTLRSHGGIRLRGCVDEVWTYPGSTRSRPPRSRSACGGTGRSSCRTGP